MKRECTTKMAVRQMLTNGENIYPTQIAETYACGASKILNHVHELEREGLCKKGGVYYTFSPKGWPIEMPWYEPIAAIAIDEQPRVDMTHPNVIMMGMYL